LSKDELDRIIETLSIELRLINKHLPYRRIGLCELLKMEIPYLVLRDGTIHLIDREELLLLKDLLGDDACKLRIPIIIETAPSLGEGTFIVRDPIAIKALSRLLEINIPQGEKLIIYRPQLYVIREKLPTTTTILFRPS
jgi:uncharacterized protein (UPF0216 family)